MLELREAALLIEYTEEVTGKEVEWSDERWYQTEECIYVDAGDLEGVFHELAHWMVALPEEREAPNLMLTDGLSDIWKDGKVRCPTSTDIKRSVRRERQARMLQYHTFSQAEGLHPRQIKELERVRVECADYQWFSDLTDHQRRARIAVVRKRAPVDKLAYIAEETF